MLGCSSRTYIDYRKRSAALRRLVNTRKDTDSLKGVHEQVIGQAAIERQALLFLRYLVPRYLGPAGKGRF